MIFVSYFAIEAITVYNIGDKGNVAEDARLHEKPN